MKATAPQDPATTSTGGTRAQTHHRSHHERRLQQWLTMFEDLGFKLERGKHVLMDFGCANGHLVTVANELGYYATGCDIAFDEDAKLNKGADIRIIPQNPYRLPYPDAFADAVVSDQVMEHVMDYPSTLAELNRVLKPGGAFIHVFPTRWIPIEPHVFVPLGAAFQSRAWLSLWANLGVRNSFQKAQSAKEVAERNLRFLKSSTHYLTKRQLVEEFGKHFTQLRWCPESFMRTGNRTRALAKIPLAPALYGALYQRVLFGRKPSQTAHTAGTDERRDAARRAVRS